MTGFVVRSASTPPIQICPTKSMTGIIKFLLLCGVVLTISPGRSFAAAPIPAAPAGAAFNAWLTAFNSGDVNLMKAFIDSYGVDLKLEDMQKIRAANGSYALLRVTLDDKLRLQALLKSDSTGQRWRIAIYLDENKTSRIAGIWLVTGSAPLP